MKKRIGISFSETNFDNYIHWFSGQSVGNEVEVMELPVTPDNLQDISSCDGLVLTGGIDIDPRWYGQSTGYPHAPAAYSPDRDKYEIAVFNLAIKNNIPVLGICRGLQLINVACKGTLIQDLGDGSGNKMHKGGPDKLHEINIVKGTLLSNITGAEKGLVNSAHHQAINKPGNGLAVNCRADDGIIEGIEWMDATGKAFMLAIQWHPERMPGKEERVLSKNIRDSFIAAIINS